MAHRVHNFNAGPAALPLPALERAQAELLDYEGTGMSILEHSHRGKEYEALHEETLSLLRELLVVPDDYEIVFLQGGASMVFATLPMNFLPRGKVADYIVTGAWGEKAIEEAVRVGEARIAGSTKDSGYSRVPTEDELSVDLSSAYVHYTTNETIHGVQFHDIPASKGVPLVADMSSDFLSRPMDVSRYAMIYAGAQKNIGPSGLVVVVVKKDFLATGRKDIPKIFQLGTHAESHSLYNTIPTFSVYLVRNVMLWLKAKGGLAAMGRENAEKARALYAAIDAHPDFYRSPVDEPARSQMNVVFRLPTPELEARFVSEAKSAGIVGLKGHRSVGGVRASIYNAVGPDSVKALIDFMHTFRQAS